ncbi:uncharacterized protein LOC128957739 [Oppia nitens]|uniref:uncharacterized protein LOC128957739 n=1 Tax=Oppia nitens TaxID=1686743 RepID=UPI0023DBE682|nr:uncharacterized protein LOC128957739 [Oppia nitens]
MSSNKAISCPPMMTVKSRLRRYLTIHYITSNKPLGWPPMMRFKSRLRRYLTIHSQRRQSFDRFGDDLSQLLLSYLSIDDKLRFESVSKQWHRLILQTVDEIIFNNNFRLITGDSLVTLLKKCPNITRIEIADKLYLLSYFSQYCQHLRHICITGNTNGYIEVNDDDNQQLAPIIDNFFVIFAKQLLTIDVKKYRRCQPLGNALYRHLKDCVNLSVFNNRLTHYRYHIYRHFFTVEPVFRRLTTFAIDIFNQKFLNIFEQIVSLYARQLTSLTILILFNDNQLYLKSLTCLSQLTQLTDLTISLYDDFGYLLPQMGQLLRSIGLQCRRLKRLSLTIGSVNRSVYNGCDIMKTICHNFKQLKRLYLYGGSLNNIDFIGSNNNYNNNTINGFKQLTHLTILSKKMSTTDQFIGNIAANCPRLQYIRYSGYRIETNELKLLIKRLTQLRTIELQNLDEDIDYSYLKSIKMFRKSGNIFCLYL